MSNKDDIEKYIAAIKEASSSIDFDKDFVEMDISFNKQASSKEDHENSYTTILTTYANNIEKTLKDKHDYKKWFFYVSLGILVLTFLATFGILTVVAFRDLPVSCLEWVSIVAPATISFLTIFIIIPEIITKYLFNLEEEKYMYRIIKSIQDYDKEKS